MCLRCTDRRRSGTGECICNHPAHHNTDQCYLICPHLFQGRPMNLSYCCEVSGIAYKTTMECIYLLQKKAARIVCNIGYQEHTNKLFFDLHVLKLIDLVKIKI